MGHSPYSRDIKQAVGERIYGDGVRRAPRRLIGSQTHFPEVGGVRKRPAYEQRGVFPDLPERRHAERDRVMGRIMAERAGLRPPEQRDKLYENLGNRELPVHKEKRKIQETIRDYQISMIEGPTGSGKSTQIGQYAIEMGYKKVVHLVPRVIPADNVADRIQFELSEQLGETVASDTIGVRHSERSTGYGKQIEVMTPDTFLRVFHELDELSDEPVLIVGDEIHEKDFSTELAVAVAASELAAHPKWRLTLMSATLDAGAVRDAYSEASGHEVPLVSVEGRPHELSVVERPDLTATEAYLEYRAEHDRALVFTAGKAEIRDMTNVLRGQRLSRTRITPLHAKLSRREIEAATEMELAEGEKQVTPATNVAQSAMTFPGLTLVVTDGTIRRPDIDEDGVEGLFREDCAQDEIIQQGGRAGRDVAGGVLVIARPDDDDFDFIPLAEREKYAPAQIHHTNISRNVLAVAALDRNFYELNRQWLINKVRQRRALDAYEVLYRLGALDEHNNITAIGLEMNNFPVRPELSRALVQARRKGAEPGRMRQLAAMISAISAGGLPYFEKGVGDAWRQDIREETKDDYAAQLDMFLATRRYYDGKEVNEAALQRRNYDLRNTRKAHRTYDKICERLGYSSDDLPEAPSGEAIAQLHGYLTAGLFDYTYRRHNANAEHDTSTYTNILDGDDARHYELSTRGTYKSRRDDALVIGFPRRFEKRDKGVLREFSVIEDVFPTTRQCLADAALWLAARTPQLPRLDQGRIVQPRSLRLGSVLLGETVTSVPALEHTAESRELLRQGVFHKPTQTVSELLDIKRRLEQLVRRVPPEDFEQYFPKGILTDERLKKAIDNAITEDVTSIYELDNALRAMVVRRNIGLETWVSDEHRQEIAERSPDRVVLGDDQWYTLYYTHGQPVVNSFNFRDVDMLPEHWYLPDGREIMINYSDGRAKRRYMAGAMKRLAAGNL